MDIETAANSLLNALMDRIREWETLVTQDTSSALHLSDEIVSRASSLAGLLRGMALSISGGSLFMASKYPQAEKRFHEAASLLKEHPCQDAANRRRIACLRMAQNSLAEAERVIGEGLGLCKEAAGKTEVASELRTETGKQLVTLGYLHREMGELASARDYFLEALQYLSIDDPAHLVALQNLTVTIVISGDEGMPSDRLARLKEIRRGRKRWSTMMAYQHDWATAVALIKSGDAKAGEKMMRKVTKFLRDQLDSPYMTTALLDLAQAYFLGGKLEMATEILQEYRVRSGATHADAVDRIIAVLPLGGAEPWDLRWRNFRIIGEVLPVPEVLRLVAKSSPLTIPTLPEPHRRSGRGKTVKAELFLLRILAIGSVPAREIHKRASAAGIPERTLRRAKARLGVISIRSGFGKNGSWEWQLPAPYGLLETTAR